MSEEDEGILINFSASEIYKMMTGKDHDIEIIKIRKL